VRDCSIREVDAGVPINLATTALFNNRCFFDTARPNPDRGQSGKLHYDDVLDAQYLLVTEEV
jgi:hypothetical protein